VGLSSGTEAQWTRRTATSREWEQILFIICRGEKRVKFQGTKIGGNFRDQWDQKHQRENQKVENSEGRKFRGRCEGAKTAKGVKMAVARGWIRDRSPDE